MYKLWDGKARDEYTRILIDDNNIQIIQQSARSHPDALAESVRDAWNN
jgi:hypothetical protein